MQTTFHQRLTNVAVPAGTCNGDTACRDNFFSDPMAAQYYRDHVRTVLTRVNSINGRLYRCGCWACRLACRSMQTLVARI